MIRLSWSMETRLRWLRRDNTRNHTKPHPTQPPPEELKPTQITGNSVILVVGRNDLLKQCTHGRNRLVPAAFQLRLDCLELGHQPLLRRLAPYDEGSSRDTFQYGASSCSYSPEGNQGQRRELAVEPKLSKAWHPWNR
jgi:hypothetical protein